MCILYDSLKEYYKNDDNFKKLIEVQKMNKISLRIIDWFVTNYSKKNNINYKIYKNSKGNLTLDSNDEMFSNFNTFHSYKSFLKSYHKSKFDPFCRKERLILSYNEKNIETTIGQLNFFKWAIDNLVLDYIEQNYKEIEDDMNKYSSNIKKQKKNERKKRQELSKSASRGLNCSKNKVTLFFD